MSNVKFLTSTPRLLWFYLVLQFAFAEFSPVFISYELLFLCSSFCHFYFYFSLLNYCFTASFSLLQQPWFTGLVMQRTSTCKYYVHCCTRRLDMKPRGPPPSAPPLSLHCGAVDFTASLSAELRLLTPSAARSSFIFHLSGYKSLPGLQGMWLFIFLSVEQSSVGDSLNVLSEGWQCSVFLLKTGQELKLTFKSKRQNQCTN